jgi:hypothetical protein
MGILSEFVVVLSLSLGYVDAFPSFLILIYLCCKQVSTYSTDCCDYCNYYVCKHIISLFTLYLQYTSCLYKGYTAVYT